MSKAKSVNLKGHREASLRVFLKYHRAFWKGNISWFNPDTHEPGHCLSLCVSRSCKHAFTLTPPETWMLLIRQRGTPRKAVQLYYQTLNTHATPCYWVSSPALTRAVLNYKKASLSYVKILSLAVDERSSCRQAEEWKRGEQRSGDVWRRTCWARGQPNSGETQKQ